MKLAELVPPGRSFENPDAEQALLGTLMVNDGVFDAVAEIVTADHFADEVHAEFFRIIAARIRGGRRVDPITVRNEARSNAVTGPAWESYLSRMTGAFTAPFMAPEYARAIRDCWVARAGKSVANDFLTNLRHDPREAATVLEEAQEALNQIVDSGDSYRPVVTALVAVNALREQLDQNWRNGITLSGISSGYAALDAWLDGFHRGGMYVIAGRPAMGKSSIGMCLAVRMALNHGRGLFWSGEMSPSELMARVIAAKTKLPSSAVISGHWRFKDGVRPLGDDVMERIAIASTEAAGIPLVIDDRPGVTVAQIATRAKRMKREKAGIAFIVLDYIGLMRGTPEARRAGNRVAEVTGISSDIARLARELDIPVVVLSQLNRQSENREDRRPTMSDIRESGAIEQDARAVIGVFREEAAIQTRMADGVPVRNFNESDSAYKTRSDETLRRLEEVRGRADLIVMKNRSGRTGTIPMFFDGPSTWFRDEEEGQSSNAW
ncbi:replicative DNA helicase [Acidomonas methanolica]|uniref:DNA 5'-3' helicase n=1 Tax=Acidomonas methanolica NBRC 104435 TaxID=1231351 RepID=A0A023D6F7_ACIMT|nr:DnaB-like helicase C-terminal domain-containing protein [Acidomonas methanolica]TCS24125.1 replicative DNA helicase [Acidomonas methanolica]GAJ29722.1 replicative DNA helicase DnaB [Acidomonas methanolica NBRC 104435]GBQ59484.1 replicative DNA helicase [Acidomonas methanolica]GEL00040.1 replicative DNA helicase [Acidomonas methanolica NBRC 104435]